MPSLVIHKFAAWSVGDFGRSDENTDETPWLDVRSKSISIKRFPGVVVGIPLGELPDRTFELPPRNVEFRIIIDSSCDIQQVGTILLGRKPWSVVYGVLIEDGDIDTDDDDATGLPFPHPRLWEPDSMIRDSLLPLLLKSPVDQIWDLGAGAGRDVCFLAESLMAQDTPNSTNDNSTIVTAYDHRYRSPAVIDDMRAFFQRRGVALRTRICCADVTTDLSDASLASSNGCCCFLLVRFWHKPLVARIAKLAPAHAWIAVSHFGKPHPNAPWPFKHPKEALVLGRSELSDMFQDGWNILYDEVAEDNDHGRTLIQFIAQKK